MMATEAGTFSPFFPFKQYSKNHDKRTENALCKSIDKNNKNILN